MRTLFLTILFAGILSAPLRADFGYQSKTKFSAGSLLKALLDKDPLARAPNKPIVATHLFKGTRMATVTKDHTTVVDLSRETILEMDFPKKTYFTMTFAQMKQILDHAMKPRTFQVTSKPAGGSKAFGFFTAREQIVTITLDPATKDSGTAAHIMVDSWLLTMPGFGEAEDFRHKLADKLSYAYASGMSAIGILEPELLPAFEEVGKLSTPGDEMPVERTIRIGDPDSGDLAPPADAPPTSQKGVVSGTLSRIGSLTHKKPAPPTDADETPGLLLELSVELNNFGSGPSDESKFNVPEGFKQAQPPH